MRRMIAMFAFLTLTGATIAGGAMASDAGPDKSAAAKTGAAAAKPEPPGGYAMRKYVLVLLYRGPNRPDDQEKMGELMKGHLANIDRLHKEGKIILAGPMLDKTDLRGIFLFDSESVEEVEKLCATDPAIQAGALRIEVHPWYSAEGITIVPPLKKAGSGTPAADAAGAGAAGKK